MVDSKLVFRRNTGPHLARATISGHQLPGLRTDAFPLTLAISLQGDGIRWSFCLNLDVKGRTPKLREQAKFEV